SRARNLTAEAPRHRGRKAIRIRSCLRPRVSARKSRCRSRFSLAGLRRACGRSRRRFRSRSSRWRASRFSRISCACCAIKLCVGHLGEMIEREFGDGSGWGIELRYSFDGTKLLGTGGALRRALPLLGDAFLVLYGDSFLPIEFAPVAAAWRASGRLGLMTVF